ncbi:MAG: glycosyl hydrolase family 57 [Methylococcales bacterium]|nr:glycosyl hydrolase family 57 [Methylococcales bacterium]
MSALDLYRNEYPQLSGAEALLEKTLKERPQQLYLPHSDIDFNAINSTCAVALHMHQPLIPAGGGDLQTAGIIGNLQYMMEHQGIGDNHNAPVFLWCYRRMAELIPQLVNEGKSPRVMLEYSGTLFHGLRSMGQQQVLDDLRTITCDANYNRCVEWLGAPWGHAVAPSTPVQDYRLHVIAWQHHFAGLYGLDALARVKGFSPSEMALPNHPDVAYEFVKTLRDCGYQWVLVQEHSVELPDSGHHSSQPHLPHRLVCKNADGEEAEIIAIIKTQGSDTKLVAQMQPFYEAQGLGRQTLAGKSIPPVVTQIADGENGGVMMNEFPPKFQEATRMASGSQTPLVNISEYLEYLFSIGLTEQDFPAVQPVKQKQIWDNVKPGAGSEKVNQVIEQLKKEDHQFHMDGGSWTNDLSWVKGYDDVLSAMEHASSVFNEKALKPGVDKNSTEFNNALYHLLSSQTSCYRYWGQGEWTDYGREICRRTQAILENDF